ncbi:hypothetical protein BKH46_09295 [Helicobacter sp. 12S02634-8]|uniref:DUF1804 family protein n=1 Tax=Helicobacter sp. 12S02634-8 TaxID=1476199 RepID=UPI000BA56FFA|nr:DUF1804 family protein [Helicobacter sp. 12S02634-8]PAF45541.1 hypothetical protein BKH46_09295 [Helicobacter sp. 12S02634-8]
MKKEFKKQSFKKPQRGVSREEIKEAYISNQSIGDICLAFDMSPSNIHYHRKKDLELGIDWIALRNENKRDLSDLERKKDLFLKKLIDAFEEILKDSGGEPLEPKLLQDFANAYYKIISPKTFDAKALIQKSAEETIATITHLALEQNKKEVANFLSENADLLIETILKKRA